MNQLYFRRIDLFSSGIIYFQLKYNQFYFRRTDLFSSDMILRNLWGKIFILVWNAMNKELWDPASYLRLWYYNLKLYDYQWDIPALEGKIDERPNDLNFLELALYIYHHSEVLMWLISILFKFVVHWPNLMFIGTGLVSYNWDNWQNNF